MRTAALKYACLLSALCSLCLCGDSVAAPVDDMLRLTPGDAGFVVVVQGWRERIAQFAKSPVAARIAATPYGQSILASADAQKFAALDEQLRKNLGVSLAKLRDEILGDALVFAYTPGPTVKPEAESGLLLLHVQDPEALSGILDRLTKMQGQAGDVTAINYWEYRGFRYLALRKKNGADEYYLVSDKLLAASNDAAQLRGLIDRHKDNNRPNVQIPPVAGRLRGLGVESDFIVCWLNPRAFDAALAVKVAAARGPEAAFLRTFESYWKLIDGAAVSLNLDKDVTIKVSVQAKTHALPAPAQQMIAGAARPSPLWTTFPKNSLFAAAGRVPWESVVDAGGEFMTTDARSNARDSLERTVGAIIGRDVLPHLLRSLGPDWGVCVTPPESAGKGWLPSLTAVMRLRTGGNGAPPVEQRVLDGLDFVARSTVVGYNYQRGASLRMRTEQQDGVDVRVIDGTELPPGLQPAFAWKGGYLVLASSPDAVRRFTPPQSDEADPAHKGEVPILRLALQGWAAYLRTYRGAVSAYLVDTYKLPVAEVDARLTRIVQGLEIFDGVEVSQSSGPARATLIFRLRSLPADEKPH
jgi:hypothetical protein